MSNKLFGNAAIYLGGNILNGGIPFLLLPVLTRVLTPADYGIVTMFGIVVSILSAFTGLSVHGAVGVRYFQLDSGKMAEYVGTCLGILFVSTALVLGIVAMAGSWLERFTQVPVEWLLAAVLMSGAQFVISIRLSLWQVQYKAARYGAFQVSQSLVNAGLSLYFILVLGMAWQGRLIGQIIAVMLFMLLGLYWLARSKEFAIPSTPREHAVDALKFGVPLIPHVIGGLFIAVSDRFVISEMLGVADVGVYTVALQFGMIVGLLADAFVKVYGPWLYQCLQDQSENTKLVVVGATYFSCISFLIVAFIVDWLVGFSYIYIVGKDFYAAIDLILLFLLGQSFQGMYYSVAGFYFFSSKTKYVAVVTLTSGIIGVLSTIILAYNFGLIGAAYGFLIGNICSFLLTWYGSRRIWNMPWHLVESSVIAFVKYARNN